MVSVILSNGILSDGENNLDLLGAMLRLNGMRVLDPLLPKRSMISARWGAGRDARALAQVSHDGDIIIGHSFGCYRAAKAAKLIRYKAIICIAPAMPSSYAWPEGNRIWCYHSRTDKALKASKLLIAHPFGGGSAGLEGFDDPSITNIPMHGAGHSDYFYGSRVIEIANQVRNI